jgi:2-phospho-L-lactate/phosphoenolpyruvate guanylyltransferase
MRTVAILPVKRFAEAKQRLGESVADPLRLELARAMVDDVLAALARTSALERTILISSEPTLSDCAREHGALVLADTAESGQSAAVSLGIEYAIGQGIERVLCVPGDCPALDPAELESLLAPAGEAPDGEVVILPDRHGSGTNGLLLSPPGAIAPSFGPDSCERHRALALAAGVPHRIQRLPSLLLDIDTGADLEVLRERLARAGAGARRTRSVLGEPEGAAVLPIAQAG